MLADSLILDPAMKFFWYFVALCLLCVLVCAAAPLIEARDRRRERWQAREEARQARSTVPPRVAGNPQEGASASESQDSFSWQD